MTACERETDAQSHLVAGTESLTEPAVENLDIHHVRVAVIGAGFSGLGMAISMLKSGENDFLIFEREEELGGTWRDNVYPGAECDIQTDLYSYSFAPNLEWSKNYAPHDELLAYLKDCSDRFGVTPHICFSHELLSASWDRDHQYWDLKTRGGNYRASILISGMGYLSEPKYPEIKGLDSFAGTAMHTARWDPEIDLGGKRVAMIGTGASAVQIIPEIQPIVGQLDVYQRTPPWIMGKHAKPIAGLGGWAMRNVPGYHRMKREYHLWTAEMVAVQMARPNRTGMMRKIAQKHLDQNVFDPELRKKMQPDYAIGCRRILFSDTFYQALQQTNVELICDPIDRIARPGVVTMDGECRDADILVLATGFQSSELPFAERIVGASGEPLASAWQEGQYAYLGSTVDGFPNFFMLLGPNTTIGHTSITLMMEAQLQYVIDALRVMKERGISSVGVKSDVASAYNRKLQDSLAPTVWNAGGCQSYYLDSRGRNTTIWPHTTPYFQKLTRRFDVENYNTTAAAT